MGNSCIKNKKVHISVQTEELVEEENFIINWESDYKTQKYHWWPMREKNKDDPINNLYGKNGGLYKYDYLFNKKSVDYQKKHHYRSCDSQCEDALWAGFCNNASILSCLYEYPRNPVLVYHNQKEMIFNPRDIECLMIVCSNNAVKKNISLFFGERNNEQYGDDEKEPYPLEFLSMLEILCKQNEPFIMDIDNGEAVWNYPYDKVQVSKHDKCDIPHRHATVGVSEYYNFKLFSNAYPNKNLDLWGFVNRHKREDGNVNVFEQWLNNKTPDFLWKKFKKEGKWEGPSNINPFIDSSVVYKIYRHSFNNENLKLVI